MRIDLELVRTLVVRMENHPSFDLEGMTWEVPGYSREVVTEHLGEMTAEGLIQSNVLRCFQCSTQYHPTRLTEKGRALAEQIKDDSKWSKTFGLIRNQGKAVGLNCLAEAVKKLAEAGWDKLSAMV